MTMRLFRSALFGLRGLTRWLMGRAGPRVPARAALESSSAVAFSRVMLMGAVKLKSTGAVTLTGAVMLSGVKSSTAVSFTAVVPFTAVWFTAEEELAADVLFATVKLSGAVKFPV
jgi:hypothetical protein